MSNPVTLSADEVTSMQEKSYTDRKIWLADLTYTQQTVAADVMPNAIGGIATYTSRHIDLESPIRLFKYPEKLIEALDEGDLPDVVGFSNYVWNFELSYGFAKLLKDKYPNIISIFGGTNFPTALDEQVAFLQEHPAIDFYIVKEGELAFKLLLDALIESDFDIETVKRLDIPSVQAISADGKTHFATSVERIRDLSEIPSPYASGLLDEFFDGCLLPIIQTNRGCPFGCTFCVEGVNYYNKVRKNGQGKIHDELEYIGKKMESLRGQGGRNDLFIADSNFGMYREDVETAEAISRMQEKYGWPEYINVATGKNQKERVLSVAKIVKGAMRLSGSVQSLDPDVLKNIKRSNIDAEGLFELGLSANEIGANTYSEIILALPGDTLQAHMSTIETAIQAGFTNIYLFQLMLLPGTEMATRSSKEKYQMDTRYRVIPRCYGHYECCGEPIVAAEIEEICVANKTLPFEDYLRARYFHLIVTIFYNDGIFGSLLKLLKQLDASTYRWLELIHRAGIDGPLKQLFDSFVEETSKELWSSREDLAEFIQQPDTVEKYIAGTLGNNLLFVHKTRAIVNHLDQLAELAGRTIKECINEQGKLNREVEAFIDDALTYHCMSGSRLFHHRETVPTANLQYDIGAFIDAGQEDGFHEFHHSEPVEYSFEFDEEQNNLIERYLNIYGETDVGIGRIISKVYVRKLFRRATTGGLREELKTESHDDEQGFQISGLQE